MLDTPYADINRLLESLLYRLRHVFQARLAGLYLYGSLVTGDFDPDCSDIDLLAITSSQITASEFEALRSMHVDLTRDNPEWDDRLDVVYLPVTALREFRTEKSLIVISPGEPFHIREGEALKDWLQNWYLVRESGLTLFGLSPKAIIPQITQEEFVEAIRRYAAEVREQVKHEMKRKGQPYTILTICRALYVLRTRQQASKKAAAIWAQAELPEWSRLIQSSLAWRQAWREEDIDHAATHSETARFVNFVSDRILA
jgi:predicted nucleotidyltransferase